MPRQIAQTSNQGDFPGKLVKIPNQSLPTINISQQELQNKNYQDLIEFQQQQLNELREELDWLKRNGVSQNKSRHPYRHFWSNINRYLAKINIGSSFGYGSQPKFTLNDVLFSYVGSFIGIATLAYLSIGSGYPLIAAPFGAAAVLVFAVPNAPLAQPRNLIFGNFIGAVVSVVMVFLFGSEPWVMALAVATAIKLMQLTKTLHPPGGAVALVGVMSEAEVNFIFTPVFLGSVILLFCTFVFNNLMPGRSYPKP
ncbi:MAG: HPP family protein [Waterburya sp.]